MKPIVRELASWPMGGEEISVRFVRALETTLLWRRLALPQGNRQPGDLWASTRRTILQATYHDRLFPPLWGPLDTDRARDTAIHACPEDAVIVGGDGIAWRSERAPEPNFGALLTGLYTLVSQIGEQAEDPYLWLSDNPAEYGLIFGFPQRLWLVPGPVLVHEDCLSEAHEHRLFTRIPDTFQANWNGHAGAILARHAVQSLLLRPAPKEEGLSADLVENLTAVLRNCDTTLKDVLAAIGGALSKLHAVLPRLEGPLLPVCKKCQRPLRNASIGCVSCASEFPMLNDYEVLGGNWVYHPLVGRKKYLSCVLPEEGSDLPRIEELNQLLAATGEARIIDSFTTSRLVSGKEREHLRQRLYLVLASPSLDTAVPDGLLKKVTGASSFDTTCSFPAASLRLAPGATASDQTGPGETAARTPPPAQSTDRLRGVTTGDEGIPALLPAPRIAAEEGTDGGLEDDADDSRLHEELEVHESRPLARILRKLSEQKGPVIKGFPKILSRTASGGTCQVVLSRTGPEFETLPTWCESRLDDAEFCICFAAVLQQVLEALEVLHSTGHVYGPLNADLIKVHRETAEARLDWPSASVPIGLVPRDGGTASGSESESHPSPDRSALPKLRPAERHWDLVALGRAVFSSLLGAEAGQDCCTHPASAACLRVAMPSLPAGWAGFLNRLRSTNPSDRFRSAAEALESLTAIAAPDLVPGLRFKAAVGRYEATEPGNNGASPLPRAFLVTPGQHAPLPNEEVRDDLGRERSFVSWETEAEGPVLASVFGPAGPNMRPGGPTAAGVVEAIDGLNRECSQGVLGHLRAIDEMFAAAKNFPQGGAGSGEEAAGHPAIEGPPVNSLPLLAASFARQGATVASEGNSRMYLFRQGVVDLLTVGDPCASSAAASHSSGIACCRKRRSRRQADEVAQGDTSAETKHLRAYRAGGGREANGSAQWRFSFQPHPGDVYCICYETLNECLDRGKIPLTDLLGRYPPAEACRKLVEFAGNEGLQESAAVVVIQVLPEEEDWN